MSYMHVYTCFGRSIERPSSTCSMPHSSVRVGCQTCLYLSCHLWGWKRFCYSGTFWSAVHRCRAVWWSSYLAHTRSWRLLSPNTVNRYPHSMLML